MRTRQESKNIYKELLKIILLCVLFFVYVVFGGIFLFLPPLIGVLFIIFMDVYGDKKIRAVIGVIVCLVMFEALNQFPLGVLALIFVLMNYVITKRFNLVFGYNSFFVFWYVGSIYLAYFLVVYIIKMFGSGLSFNLNLIFIYYFFVESLIGLFYEKIKTKI